MKNVFHKYSAQAFFKTWAHHQKILIITTIENLHARKIRNRKDVENNLGGIINDEEKAQKIKFMNKVSDPSRVKTTLNKIK